MNIDEIVRRASKGNYLVGGDVSNADCLVGFAFGYRQQHGKILPGISNEQLAAFASKFRVPKILQFEIADAYAKNDLLFRIEQHSLAGQYLDTLEVARQALDCMQQHKLHTAVIIAHPCHMPRTLAICNKLSMSCISPPGLENIEFDPQSEQEWTRSRQKWIDNEAKSILNAAEANII